MLLLQICHLQTQSFWRVADLRFADPISFMNLEVQKIRKNVFFLIIVLA
jgi:hypothetical protein